MKKHGVTISCGNIKYGNFDFEMRLKCVKSGAGMNGEKMLFEEYCEMYGFKKSDYGKELVLDGKLFRFIGVNLKAPKNCCSIRCVEDNEVYKCSAEVVRRALY